MASSLIEILEGIYRNLPAARPRRRRRNFLEPIYTTEAEQRAEDLLQRHLSPRQRRTLKRHGWFKVQGKDGSTWTLRRSRMPFNVSRTDRDGTTQPYCSQLGNAPLADTLLVQKLCIEATGGQGLPVTWDGVTLTDENLFRPAR
jgi:hypothetical protein